MTLQRVFNTPFCEATFDKVTSEKEGALIQGLERRVANSTGKPWFTHVST